MVTLQDQSAPSRRGTALYTAIQSSTGLEWAGGFASFTQCHAKISQTQPVLNSRNWVISVVSRVLTGHKPMDFRKFRPWLIPSASRKAVSRWWTSPASPRNQQIVQHNQQCTTFAENGATELSAPPQHVADMQRYSSLSCQQIVFGNNKWGAALQRQNIMNCIKQTCWDKCLVPKHVEQPQVALDEVRIVLVRPQNLQAWSVGDVFYITSHVFGFRPNWASLRIIGNVPLLRCQVLRGKGPVHGLLWPTLVVDCVKASANV